MPWLDEGLFDLRSKDGFKENFARAVCCALPPFDLVIVDEAHNLKGGIQSQAWRNRLLALTTGARTGWYAVAQFRIGSARAASVDAVGYAVGRRLSTCVEPAGGGRARSCRIRIRGSHASEEARAIYRGFSFDASMKCRRVDAADEESVSSGMAAGGVETHDEPLRTPDERQQLVVALVQKKVSELLEIERFNHSFQIGMLASFESFLQTAKVRRIEEGPSMTLTRLTTLTERQGIDVHAVNRLAGSYAKKFGHELPHPKMDALVQELRRVFTSGEKALVFVRRVASVKELQQKLETEYDAWLIEKLKRELRPDLQSRFEAIYEQYSQERRTRRPKAGLSMESAVLDVELDDRTRTSPPGARRSRWK